MNTKIKALISTPTFVLVTVLLSIAAFHSCVSDASASQLPCEKEGRRAERVCKAKGEDSLECENAWHSYERCMDEADPIGGIGDGC